MNFISHLAWPVHFRTSSSIGLQYTNQLQLVLPRCNFPFPEFLWLAHFQKRWCGRTLR